jgi:hypothetical protein
MFCKSKDEYYSREDMSVYTHMLGHNVKTISGCNPSACEHLWQITFFTCNQLVLRQCVYKCGSVFYVLKYKCLAGHW